jgi:hypothetical protein
VMLCKCIIETNVFCAKMSLEVIFFLLFSYLNKYASGSGTLVHHLQ